MRKTISTAGLRHMRTLREREETDDDAYWRPSGGEVLCAQRLFDDGLLTKFMVDGQEVHGLTAEARRVLAEQDKNR